ncbi:hypothetical protein Dimus_027326, partial [Dionaea muscipula]
RRFISSSSSSSSSSEDVSGFVVRRGREGDRTASGAWSLPFLRRAGAGGGCTERVAILLPPFLLQDQAQVLVLLLHSAASLT